MRVHVTFYLNKQKREKKQERVENENENENAQTRDQLIEQKSDKISKLLKLKK